MRLQPLGQLPLLLLGAEIDGAQPLALDLQPLQPALDVARRRAADRRAPGRCGGSPDAAACSAPPACAPRPRAAARRQPRAAPRRGRGSRAPPTAPGSRRPPPCRARTAGSRPAAAGRPRPCAGASASRQLRHQRAAASSISSGAPSSAAARRALRCAARRAPRSGGRHSRLAQSSSCARRRSPPAGGALLGLALQPVMAGARIGKRRAVALHLGRAALERACSSRQVGRLGQPPLGLGDRAAASA